MKKFALCSLLFLCISNQTFGMEVLLKRRINILKRKYQEHHNEIDKIKDLDQSIDEGITQLDQGIIRLGKLIKREEIRAKSFSKRVKNLNK